MARNGNGVGTGIKEISKWVYFIIAGLAMTIGLQAVVFNTSAVAILLYVALVLTLLRFTFGYTGNILNEQKGNKPKPFGYLVLDIHFYLVNALLFVIIAYNLDSIMRFTLSYVGMLIIDIIWILYDHYQSYLKFKKDVVRKQFIYSDLVMGFVFLLNLTVIPLIFMVFTIERHLPIFQAIILLATCLGAAVWDYRFNEEYYKAL